MYEYRVRQIPAAARPMPFYLSRAHFLRLTAGTVVGASLAGVLAGCGGGEEEPAAPPATTEVPSVSDVPLAPTGGTVGGRLDYFGWQGYDLQAETKAWREENAVEFKPAYMTNYPDVIPKLKGGGQIDVTNGDVAYNALFRELGVLTRFTDRSLVPNLEKINPRFLDNPAFTLEDGSLTGAPFSWGTFALVYNTETVEAVPKKWIDLLEQEFTGRITILDDPIVSFEVAALGRGQEDIANQTPDQLSESVEYMKKMKAQAKTIAPSYGDVITLFQNGEIDAAFGPAGWAALKLFVGRGVKLDNVFPEDRSVTYLTSYYVPEQADNGATAFAWIDQTLTPEVQTGVTSTLGEGIVTTDIVDELSPDVRDFYPYDDIDSFLDRNPYYALPPRKPPEEIASFDDWHSAWNEVKAS